MSEASPYRRWWKSLDEGRKAMAVDVWRNGDFKALHDLLPPENQHGGSDTWVNFGKVRPENEPRGEDISWVITDDNLTKFMKARFGETQVGHPLGDFATPRDFEGDEPQMAAWWAGQISGEDRDAWCEALDDGVVTTEMALTILPGFRDRGARDWLKSATTTSAITSTAWTMTAPFQAFIAEQCDQRLG
jgi:hypothetical protein